MLRTYAFEAEGVSEEVKSQLEKVENVVEEKCDSVDACDKMLEKIDKKADEFNGALSDMKDAAQACKDGECSKADMAEKIAPKMAELKEVAKAIGVATEGDTVTQDELNDAKDYLEGAKEIVESKKAELEGSESKGDESKNDDDDEGCDDDEAAEEAFLDMAQQLVDNLRAARYAGATEGVLSNFFSGLAAANSVREAKKAAKIYIDMKSVSAELLQALVSPKEIDTSAEGTNKLKEAVSEFNKLMADTGAGDCKMSIKKFGEFSIGVYAIGGNVIELHIPVAGAKKIGAYGAHHVNSQIQKMARRAAPAAESNTSIDYNAFIEACESVMVDRGNDSAASTDLPYLFD